MTAALVACLGIWQTNNLSRSITFDSPVSYTPETLKALSDQTGLSFEAVGPISAEILFVHADQRPLQETLDHIAEVTKGEWSRQLDGTYVLRRSASLAARIQQDESNQLAQQLKDWRDQYVQDLDRPMTEAMAHKLAIQHLGRLKQDSYDPRLDRDRLSDPIYRAFARCLRQVDLNAIATMDIERRYVFSTRPTATQFPLPPAFMSLLQSEQATWKHEFSKVDWRYDDGKIIHEFQTDEASATQVDTAFQYLGDYPKPWLGLLTVQRTSHDEFEWTFKVINHDLQTMIDLSENWMAPPPDAGPLMLDQLNRISLPKANELTQQVWAVNAHRCDQNDPSTKSLFRRMGKTGAIDFYRAGNQELLTALGRSFDKSVVACLPSDSLIQGESGYEFRSLLRPMRHTVERNWITFAPASFTQHWATKFSRARLVDALNEIQPTGQVNLPSFVRLAMGEPAMQITNGPDFADGYLISLGSRTLPQLPTIQSFVRLFSLLSDDQLARLKQGEILPYRALSKEQLSAAKNIVFGLDRCYWEEGKPPTLLAALDPTFELTHSIFDGPGIGLEIQNDPIIVYGDTADELDWQNLLMNSDRKDFFKSQYPRDQFVAGPDKVSRIVFGTKRRFTLRCYLSPGHSRGGDFTEPTIFQPGPYLRYCDLNPQQQALVRHFVGFTDIDQLRQRLVDILSKITDPDDAKRIQKFIDDIDKRLAGKD